MSDYVYLKLPVDLFDKETLWTKPPKDWGQYVIPEPKKQPDPGIKSLLSDILSNLAAISSISEAGFDLNELDIDEINEIAGDTIDLIKTHVEEIK